MKNFSLDLREHAENIINYEQAKNYCSYKERMKST